MDVLTREKIYMFDTDNLHDERVLASKRRRVFGEHPLIGEKVNYALYSASKGAIYLMCSAKHIFKVYPRLDVKPHSAFVYSIVGVKGSEHLRKSELRAIDVIDHITETKGEHSYHYSQLVLHSKSGQCFILCEDPQFLSSGHARLQIEMFDKYPPNDAICLHDFKLPLPAVRTKNDCHKSRDKAL